MSVEVRTKGTVLASYDLSQTDKMFVCYTSDFGKMDLIGRGVKKASSRLASHLEPFIVNELVIILGVKNSVIRSCFAIDNFWNLRRNLKLYFAASYLLDLTDKLTIPNDPENQIFSLLTSSLHMLNEAKSQKEIDLIIAHFQFRIMDHTGYRPHLDNCVVCHNAISENDLVFSVKFGGVMHSRHKIRDKHAFKISSSMTRRIQEMLESDHDKKSFSGDKNVFKEMIKIGYLLVTYQLGKRVKSERFLDD